jgi:predicted dehydrogenase
MSAPLRLGLIGCGRIAEHGHVPAIAACPEAELVAVADPVAPRRDALAERAGGGAFAAAGELLTQTTLDAVIVASPVADHLEHARLVAAAGLPCLIEKPPAADAAGAVAIAALEPTPWIGFNRRFQQGVELVERVPADGPLELELELRYRRDSWRAHGVRDDALLDLGPHLADLALLLGGAPARVVAADSAPERARIELETPRGAATIRCATDRAHFERVAVGRPGGPTLAASTSDGPLRGALARLRRAPHPLVASLGRQLDAFVACVRGEDPGLLASAADGVRAMELIDAASALAAHRPRVAA